MFWDDLVRRWRREAKVVSPQLLRGAGGHVAVLPAPRQRRRSRLELLLLVLLAIAALLFVGSGRVSRSSGEAEASLVAVVLRAGDA
jgi:hypothetical protein